MNHTVYILFSESIGRYYIGQTSDLENRITEHNHGETRSIKNGTPWKIVWTQELPSRSEAMKLETRIKKRGGEKISGRSEEGRLGKEIGCWSLPNPKKKLIIW